jgi:hypothetical protein
MFDRIVMNVIQVMLKIPLISDHMFPVPPLPDPAFPFALPAR